MTSQPAKLGPVRVDALGADADGIASLPGGAQLYLPGTLPGELVQPGPLTRRGQAWTADSVVLEPAPERIAPPCPHFGLCGGCALQHLDTAAYAAWKQDQVAAPLRRLGFAALLPPLARTAPGQRRRIDLAIRREQGAVVIGLHQRRAAAIVDMHACPILHPALFAVVKALRPTLRALSGLKREGSAILNLLDTGPDLLLRTDAPLTARDRARLADFAREAGLPRISGATGPHGPPEPACALGPAVIRFSGYDTRLPPGAFLQASQPGEAAIRAAVLDALPKLAGKARIIELFAGAGALTHALAERAPTLAFEGDPSAFQALREAANPRVVATQRDLARQPLQPAELKAAAAIVLDPPWAGATAQMPALAASGLPIVYVSCNPAALLRDGQVLARAGYAIGGAMAIDQFLWSARVEAVVAFTRSRAG